MDTGIFDREDLENKLILVNEQDEVLGESGKIEAHQKGLLHRAFSIFIFNTRGELLVQQRALEKYHSGGMWANTCCGHPYPLEDTLKAAERRLFEELYINVSLKKEFTTRYTAELDNGLSENELVHVYYGLYDDSIRPNPKEAMNWSWFNLDELKVAVKENPAEYAFWFRFYINEHFEEILTMQEKILQK